MEQRPHEYKVAPGTYLVSVSGLSVGSTKGSSAECSFERLVKAADSAASCAQKAGRTKQIGAPRAKRRASAERISKQRLNRKGP